MNAEKDTQVDVISNWEFVERYMSMCSFIHNTQRRNSSYTGSPVSTQDINFLKCVRFLYSSVLNTSLRLVFFLSSHAGVI